ncbi:MarR family transcriptional regulator [Cellulosimicrobium arenosum]|uniref:MarR family transcriptional regulator n=1 Tax=Cellulosimicrobium arenosum TaxID=2708133 RepID=A0A927G5S8_9MICO|nr:MarR family transcriptional regulator [Cellulosimicrobium arenosum]
MNRSSSEKPASRDELLAALADSGRELSTAVILFHTNLARRVGLGPSEEKVLELVHRHRHATVSELAEHAAMRKNSLSDTLDRLEDKGFVERRPHPGDGRKVSVIGTASGLERIGTLFDGLMSGLSELNADYTTEELAVIAEYQHRAAEIQTAASHSLAGDATPSR